MPFNGVNPHSVVVLDNCSIHHSPYIYETFHDVGVLVYYLSPYSPDLNPIEETFSKVKHELQSPGNLGLPDDVDEIESLVLASFLTVTPQDCKGWISSTGIY